MTPTKSNRLAREIADALLANSKGRSGDMLDVVTYNDIHVATLSRNQICNTITRILLTPKHKAQQNRIASAMNGP